MKMEVLSFNDFKKYFKTIKKLLMISYLNNFDISEESCEKIVDEKMIDIEAFIQMNKVFFVIALFEDRLAGFVWLYIHDYIDKKRLHINHIVVDNNYRGRGIAKELLKKTEDIATSLGIEIIDLLVSEDNNIALKLYEKAGFQTERRSLIKKI